LQNYGLYLLNEKDSIPATEEKNSLSVAYHNLYTTPGIVCVVLKHCRESMPSGKVDCIVVAHGMGYTSTELLVVDDRLSVSNIGLPRST